MNKEADDLVRKLQEEALKGEEGNVVPPPVPLGLLQKKQKQQEKATSDVAAKTNEDNLEKNEEVSEADQEKALEALKTEALKGEPGNIAPEDVPLGLVQTQEFDLSSTYGSQTESSSTEEGQDVDNTVEAVDDSNAEEE